MKSVSIQQEPIDIAAIVSTAGTPDDGAVVCFIGRARKKSATRREVSHLEYEVYGGMAYRELARIADDAVTRWSLSTCIVVHRYGTVQIGEASVILVVSSPHRDDSYQASRYIIDTIKKTVPIWKKEVYTDGSVWISETP